MRLLIDEMYPPAVAEQLRERDRDVVSVAERKEWRSLNDAAIFDIAQSERRAIVTENISDFVALADIAEQRGAEHYGLILVNPAKFPRGQRRVIGALARSLVKLLDEFEDDQPCSLRVWL